MSRVANIFQRFNSQSSRLERTRIRVETTVDAGALRITDAELYYESALVTSYSYFEAALEDLLIGMVCEGENHNRRLKSRIIPSDRKSFEEILRRGEDYSNFLPYGKALEHAKLYLRGGGPFAVLSEGLRSPIAQGVFVRNAIAHRSNFAISKFRSKVNGVDTLPQNRRTPGAYLRSTMRDSPPLTRYEMHINAMKLAIFQIVETWVGPSRAATSRVP